MVKDKFFQQYHRAVVLSAKGDKKFFMQIGKEFSRKFFAENSPKDFNDFKEKYKKFLLENLEFAESVDYDEKENEFVVKIRGCQICQGNEVLRQEKKETACPIIYSNLYSLAEFGNVSFLNNEKGKVGDCNQKFRLEKK